MTEAIAVAKLRALIERVERIEADIAEMNSDKSAVYKEIRGEGYDVKTVRKIVSKRKLDTNERQEQDALFDLYWNALNGTGTEDATRVHVHEDGSYAEQKGVRITPSSGDVFADLGVERPSDARLHAMVQRNQADSPSAVHPPAETTGAVASSPAAAPVSNSHSSEPNSSQAETKTGADDLLPSVPVTPLPAARFPTVAGGHPSEPSSDAGAGEQVAGTADMHDTKSERAAPNSPAHGPCEGIARKTPKTEPALDALAGDLGSTPCKGQNRTPPANHSDDVPAFIRAPVNERCLNQGSCQYARHPHKITCSDCGSAFIKKRAEARL